MVSPTDLASGERFAARFDVLLVAVGILPNVELAAAAGVLVDDGVVVDASGRASIADVFAAGGGTNHPVAGGSRPARYQSWQVARSKAAAVGARPPARRGNTARSPGSGRISTHSTSRCWGTCRLIRAGSCAGAAKHPRSPPLPSAPVAWSKRRSRSTPGAT